MKDITDRNNQQTQGVLGGFNQSIPAGMFRDRMSALTSSLGNSGRPPEAALKMGQPLIKEATSLMRSENQAAGAQASMGLRQQGQEFSQSQRLREKAAARIQTLVTNYKLPAAIEKFKTTQETLDNINLAEAGNGDAGPQAITNLVRLTQDRVSDSDFKNASRGAFTIWQQLKRGATEALVHDGFDPDHAANLREVVGILAQSQERAFRQAQNQMLSVVKADRTISPEERDMYIIATAQNIPQDYWDPLVRQYMNVDSPSGTGSPPAERTQAPPAAADHLGVAPLPKTLDGSAPKKSPNGVPLVPGRIGRKPPAKPTKKMLEDANEDELMKMFREAADAP